MKEYAQKVRAMEKALRSTGIRISAQRRAILEYLAPCTSHPGARQVFRAVREKHPALSLATVYNTLGILTRLGLVKVMQFDGTDSRYDPNVAPHINLICTACGGIEDLEQSAPVLAEDVRARVGFAVHDCRMEYYGICRECRAKENDECRMMNDE